jgi:hypothetical protein
MADGGILVAATSATFAYEGQTVWLTQGRTTVREGHPILKGREHLFKPFTIDYELPEPKKAETAPRRPAAKG